MPSLKDKAYKKIKFEIIIGNFKPGLFLTEEKLSKKGGKISKPLQVKRSKARKEKLEKADTSSVNKSRTRGRIK